MRNPPKRDTFKILDLHLAPRGKQKNKDVTVRKQGAWKCTVNVFLKETFAVVTVYVLDVIMTRIFTRANSQDQRRLKRNKQEQLANWYQAKQPNWTKAVTARNPTVKSVTVNA